MYHVREMALTRIINGIKAPPLLSVRSDFHHAFYLLPGTAEIVHRADFVNEMNERRKEMESRKTLSERIKGWFALTPF